MAQPSEDAIRHRVISHMNADHHDSVARYAEYFGKASRFASRNARITDISLDKWTITAGSQTLSIPFQPPMASLREARERAVEMDKQSIAGLNRSPVTLKEYRAPTGLGAVLFITCLSTYLLLSRRENMIPGHLPYDLVLKHVPKFASFALQMRDIILWPMIAIHLTEAYFMTKRLEKHSVPLFSRVWWLWTISCFMEGFTSFQRISAIEREKSQKTNNH